MIAEQTVHDAGELTYYILRHEIYKDTEINTDENVLQKALNTALVVTYARPFSRNHGAAQLLECLNIREIYSEEEFELHELVRTLRNRLSAHSDASEFSFFTTPQNRYVPMLGLGVPTLNKEDLERLRSMLTKLMDAIRAARANLGS